MGALDETDIISKRFGKLPDHVKIVRPDFEYSTHSFFPITDYCLTVRGTIGMEMPCYGIPTFTGGTGRYSGLGFTIDSSSREDYLNKLRSIQDIPPLDRETKILARKHTYALFKSRLLFVSSFSNIIDVANVKTRILSKR